MQPILQSNGLKNQQNMDWKQFSGKKNEQKVTPHLFPLHLHYFKGMQV